MSERGRLVVISGPSGAGKTSICRELLRRSASELERVVTATTRAPRGRERDGVDYLFLDRDEFDERIRDRRFLEHADVYGHLYGTPREQVEEGIARGSTLLLNIDVQGARQLRDAGIDGLMTIFIEPPSFEALEERLRGRGTDPQEVVRRRLEQAREEMGEKSKYDHVVVNDELERAAAEVVQLIDCSTGVM
ncbi:MAG: guanylate kinase [Planctomycetota bacterium]|nr:guanylate kinase [Planctomycetota bacterium]